MGNGTSVNSQIEKLLGLITRMAEDRLSAKGKVSKSDAKFNTIIRGLYKLIEIWATQEHKWKQAGERLRESQAYHRFLFDRNLAGVYKTKINGEIVDCNDSFARILGYSSREEILKLKAGDLYFSPSDRKRFLARLKEKGILIGNECRMQKKDGTEIWVVENASLLNKETILGTMIDITERRRVEEKMGCRSEELALINTLNKAVNRDAGLEEVFDLLLKEVKKIFSASGAAIYLLSEDEKALELVTMGLPDSIIRRIEKLLGFNIAEVKIHLKRGSLYKKALRDGKPQLLEGPGVIRKLMNEFTTNLAPARTPNKKDIEKLLPQIQKIIGIRSVINIPLISNGKPIGLFDISRKEPFASSDLHRLEVLAEEMASVIKRKQAEDNLKKWAHIFKHAEWGIVTCSNDGRLDLMNPAFARMHGYTIKELRKRPVPDVFAPEKQADFLEQFEIACKKGNHSFESLGIRKDGTVFPVLVDISAVKDDKGKTLYCVVNVRDITDRKRIEKDLIESEKKYRTTFETTGTAITIIDEDTTISLVNSRFEKLSGYSRAELEGKISWTKFVVPEDLSRMKQYHQKRRIDPNAAPSQYEFRFVNRYGKIRHVLINIAMIPGTGKSVASLMDITELKRTEARMKKALQEAKRSEKVKTLFLANMSHEIRTPLNAILGFSQLIKEQTKQFLTDEERSYFDMIENAGQRLLNTVHEILDMSQIEAGAMKLRPERLDLSELTEEAIREFLPAVSKKGLELTFRSRAKDSMVEVDKYCVFRALANLLDNAIKFTAQGNVEVVLYRRSGKLKLIIKDTGIGISRKYRKKLFEIFSQESTGYAKSFQGVGLGLALTKRYLDMNGVDIKIRSVKGKGTTVILTFKPVNPGKSISKRSYPD